MDGGGLSTEGMDSCGLLARPQGQLQTRQCLGADGHQPRAKAEGV